MALKKNSGRKSWLSIVLVLLLLVIALFRTDLFRGNNTQGDLLPDAANNTELFNRDPDKLVYSRHARCRMDCRQIDEDEVEEILIKGKINHAKSDTGASGDPRYALEGITSDNQHVRIVYASTKETIVVVTCIDLKTDWACNCPD